MNFDNYPKTPNHYKKELVTPLNNSPFEGDENSIRCPKCSNLLDIVEVEEHSKNCKYKNCEYCEHYFPEQILQEHYLHCEKNPRMEEEEIESEDHEYEEENFYNQNQQQSLQQRNQQLIQNDFFQTPQFSNIVFQNNSSNGYGSQHIIRTNNDGTTTIEVIENTPSGVRRNVTRVSRDGNQSQNISVVNNRLYSGNEFDDIFTNNFLQNFMNHGNFMRTQRINFLNNNFLENILEQLQNQNQERGMDLESINQIEKIKFNKKKVKNNEEEKCPICINEYEDQESLRKLKCNHLFHPECIDTWLVQNSLCPVCKADVKN